MPTNQLLSEVCLCNYLISVIYCTSKALETSDGMNIRLLLSSGLCDRQTNTMKSEQEIHYNFLGVD